MNASVRRDQAAQLVTKGKLETRREKDRDRKREKAKRNSTTASRPSSTVGSSFSDLISTSLTQSLSGASVSPAFGRRTLGPSSLPWSGARGTRMRLGHEGGRSGSRGGLGEEAGEQ